MFALEVKKILQATPSKLRREMGMCATTIDVQQQQQYFIRYEYSLYVLQSRASRSRCSIPGISGRVDTLTSPVPAARAAVATGAWVESKRMYLIHMWKCGSVSFIFTYSPQDEKRKKRKAYLVPGAVHASTQQTTQIRGTGVCLVRKNSL